MYMTDRLESVEQFKTESKIMNFTTKGVDTTKDTGNGISQFLEYGIKYCMINNIEVKTASTGSKQCILHMESAPVTLEGFKPNDDATNGGQIGKVKFPGAWVKTNDPLNMERFIKDVAIMGDKLNVRDRIDSINAVDFDSYVSQVLPIVKGKYAWWKLAAEEYFNRDGKRKYSLALAKFGFIASKEEGEGHLRFDKSNIYDYKTADADNSQLDAASTNGAAVTDDLPF